MNRKSILEKYQLAKIKEGDTESFAKLYDDIAPKIYRFIFFKVGSVEEAEDITSQAFLKVWNYVRDGESEIKSLQAFVYRVARNLIVDYYREHAKSPKFEALPLDDFGISSMLRDETLDTSAELASDIAILYKTLKELKEEYREILVLKYVDEFSTGEIADILQKNTGAVRTQLSRALEALREILPEDISINERKRIHTKPKEA